MRIFALIIVVSLSGCITVPPEVVQLSSRTSTDIQALHNGYRSLVRRHFTALRKIREQEFSEKILGPFIENAIKEGRLVEVVQGKVVWSSDKDDFVDPDPAKATVQKLDSLRTWNREISEGIEDLRTDAYSDLDSSEAKVLDEVDRAFGNVIRGNSAIHGYLLSIKKVEAAGNEVLKDLGLEDLPKKVNDALDKASIQAAAWTAKVNEADGKAKNLKSKIQKMKGK